MKEQIINRYYDYLKKYLKIVKLTIIPNMIFYYTKNKPKILNILVIERNKSINLKYIIDKPITCICIFEYQIVKNVKLFDNEQILFNKKTKFLVKFKSYIENKNNNYRIQAFISYKKCNIIKLSNNYWLFNSPRFSWINNRTKKLNKEDLQYYDETIKMLKNNFARFKYKEFYMKWINDD